MERRRVAELSYLDRVHYEGERWTVMGKTVFTCKFGGGRPDEAVITLLLSRSTLSRERVYDPISLGSVLRGGFGRHEIEARFGPDDRLEYVGTALN